MNTGMAERLTVYANSWSVNMYNSSGSSQCIRLRTFVRVCLKSCTFTNLVWSDFDVRGQLWLQGCRSAIMSVAVILF